MVMRIIQLRPNCKSTMLSKPMAKLKIGGVIIVTMRALLYWHNSYNATDDHNCLHQRIVSPKLFWQALLHESSPELRDCSIRANHRILPTLQPSCSCQARHCDRSSGRGASASSPRSALLSAVWGSSVSACTAHHIRVKKKAQSTRS